MVTCRRRSTWTRGEILELKNTINNLVDQLSAFAEQVTRVAREVGTRAGWAVRRSARVWQACGAT